MEASPLQNAGAGIVRERDAIAMARSSHTSPAKAGRHEASMTGRGERAATRRHTMNIARLIRQLRRSAGVEPVGISDYVMPAVGILALGMLAGAGVALLFAPMTGEKLRAQVENRLMDFRARLMLQQGDPLAVANHAGHIAPNNAKPAETFPRI
jgi:hypothetical protein